MEKKNIPKDNLSHHQKRELLVELFGYFDINFVFFMIFFGSNLKYMNSFLINEIKTYFFSFFSYFFFFFLTLFFRTKVRLKVCWPRKFCTMNIKIIEGYRE